MKIIALIISFFVGSCGITRSAETETVKVIVDTEKMMYQACFFVKRDVVEYDALDFTPPYSGMAPFGARAHIRGKREKVITEEQGYSSIEYWSGDPWPETKFTKIPESGQFCSEWFKISDLLRSFARDTKIPIDDWKKIRISFRVDVRTGSGVEKTLRGQSAWVRLSPAKRKLLAEPH